MDGPDLPRQAKDAIRRGLSKELAMAKESRRTWSSSSVMPFLSTPVLLSPSLDPLHTHTHAQTDGPARSRTPGSPSFGLAAMNKGVHEDFPLPRAPLSRAVADVCQPLSLAASLRGRRSKGLQSVYPTNPSGITGRGVKGFRVLPLALSLSSFERRPASQRAGQELSSPTWLDHYVRGDLNG